METGIRFANKTEKKMVPDQEEKHCYTPTHRQTDRETDRHRQTDRERDLFVAAV